MSLSTGRQRITGALWCFPVVLSFYFMLTERQARSTNAVLLLSVVPLQWNALEDAMPSRASITLIPASIFSAIFIRVVSCRKKSLQKAKAFSPGGVD